MICRRRRLATGSILSGRSKVLGKTTRYRLLCGALLALAAALAPGLELRADAKLVRGPYLQALLENSVKVLWTTDAPSPGRVRFAKEDIARKDSDIAGAAPHEGNGGSGGDPPLKRYWRMAIASVSSSSPFASTSALRSHSSVAGTPANRCRRITTASVMLILPSASPVAAHEGRLPTFRAAHRELEGVGPAQVEEGVVSIAHEALVHAQRVSAVLLEDAFVRSRTSRRDGTGRRVRPEDLERRREAKVASGSLELEDERVAGGGAQGIEVGASIAESSLDGRAG